MNRRATWLLGIAGGAIVAAAGAAAYFASAVDDGDFLHRVREQASGTVAAAMARTTCLVRNVVGADHHETGANFCGVSYRIESQRSSRWALRKVSARAELREATRLSSVKLVAGFDRDGDGRVANEEWVVLEKVSGDEGVAAKKRSTSIHEIGDDVAACLVVVDGEPFGKINFAEVDDGIDAVFP